MASGRLERRYVSLHLAANSFHCRSRTASDMKCKLNITFLDESKISTKTNLARVGADEQNGPLAFGSLPEKAVRNRRKLRDVVFATLVYKQPTKLWTTAVSSSLRGRRKKGKGGGWERGKKGKGKGAPAIRANVFWILPTNSLTNPITSLVYYVTNQNFNLILKINFNLILKSRGRFSAWPKLNFFVYRKLS